MTFRVVLEIAPKRSFASALDWPGWSRAGRSPDDALEALVAYGSRYARVTARSGVAFTRPSATDDLDVVERLEGSGTTEFGAPGVAAAAEDEPLQENELGRFAALLRAAWDELDEVARGARGHELRKGPRGGGRELDPILGHVRDAEAAYLGQLGARPPKTEELEPIREALLETLEARVTGRPIDNPRRTKHPWSPRYAVRRAAWHVLDHAWEIEDRLTPSG